MVTMDPYFTTNHLLLLDFQAYHKISMIIPLLDHLLCYFHKVNIGLQDPLSTKDLKVPMALFIITLCITILYPVTYALVSLEVWAILIAHLTLTSTQDPVITLESKI